MLNLSYLKTKLSEGQEKGFFTGGIVTGQAGLDKVPARLTAGEVVFNKSQQQELLSMANGGGINSGSRFNNNFGSNGSATEIIGVLTTRLRGSDIDISARLGAKQNNKFK